MKWKLDDNTNCLLAHLFFCNDYTRKEQGECVYKQTKTGGGLVSVQSL